MLRPSTNNGVSGWSKREGELSGTLVEDDAPTVIEVLLIETEAAIAAGTPLPTASDAQLSQFELDEFEGMQECLQLLNNARREGWLENAKDTLTAEPDLPWLASANLGGGLPHIGRFEIVRELGRGGHGVVFLARDPGLRRLVALKVARPECLVSDDLRKRFHREAMAAGGLRHDNIIEVYEVGEFGPASYIASAYCEGQTLQQWLAEVGRQATDREAAAVVAAIASAVEHAHSKGVLHRDIKPSNVLLQPAATTIGSDEEVGSRKREPLGSYIPKLTDFGLAKLLDATDEHTRTGSTLGTPAYMAPEQASGRIDRIGPATDVYALGVLLYEMLAGCPPFRGESDIDTARRVCEDEPIPLRRLRPSVSLDLEAICLHCLEKDPVSRYQTAGAVHEDLLRFLTGMPTIVRPVSQSQAAVRWIKRRPLHAALLCVSLALIVCLAGGGWWASLRTKQALHRESALRSEAEASNLKAVASSAETKRLLYASDMRVAHQLYLNGNLKASRDLLQTHLPKPGNEDLREFSWHYINYRTQPGIATFRGHSDGVRMAVISGDGTHLLSIGNDGCAKLWNVNSRVILLTLPSRDVDVAAFSSDGLRCAIAGERSAWIYFLDDLEHPRALSHEIDRPTSLKFSTPHVSLDEELIAIAGDSGRAELWRVADTKSPANSMQLEGPVSALAFSNQGELAIASGRKIQWYRTSDDFGLASSSTMDADVTCVEYSNARIGKVAICLSNGQVIVRSIAGDATDVVIPHARPVTEVTFDANGVSLVTAGSDSIARLWDLSRTTCTKEFVGHADRIVSAGFCMNGARLMTASDDGSVKVYRVADANFTVVDRPHFGINELGFSSDSRLFVWTGYPTEGNVPACTGLVELPSLMTDVVHGAAGCFADLQFLQEPRRFIAIANSGGRADVRLNGVPAAVSSTNEPKIQEGFAPKITATSDGTTLVWGDVYPLYITYEFEGGAQRIGPKEKGEVVEMRINPFTEEFVLVASARELAKWDLKSRQCTGRWKMPSSIRAFDFIDKDRIALAGADSILRVIDINSGKEHVSFPSNEGPIRSVAVHPNGRTLALGHADAAISLWDLSVNRQLLSFAEHKSEVTCLRFSPDGQYLASGGAPGHVFIWSAPQIPQESLTPFDEKPKSEIEAKVLDRFDASVKPQRVPATVPFHLADLPEKFRRVYDYGRSVGYSAAFPTCIDQETDDGIAVGVVAFKPGVCRWGEAPESEVTGAMDGKAGVEGLLMRHWRAIQWGKKYKQSLVFSNFHQGIQVDRPVRGVIEIDAKAYLLERANAVVPAEADSLSNRLRMLNSEALRRGYHGALPTCEDDDAGQWIGAAFFKPESAEVLSVPAHLLSN